MNMYLFPTLMLICALYSRHVNSERFTVLDSLYRNLTNGHNKYFRPEVDLNTTTIIYVDFNLLNLEEINAVDGTVSLTGYFHILWIDQHMKWNASDYDGTNVLVLPQDQLWRPPMLNSNTAKQYRMFGDELPNSYLFVDNNGLVIWSPGENLKFTCNIDTSDFPFDTQTCDMNVIVWGYPTGSIKLSLAKNTIDTGMYTENSEWDLINITAEADNNGRAMIKFRFIFERRPLFLIINLILPIVFIAMLNICVFFLPHDSGERMGFSITLLLAVVVYLTIAQGMLPATAKPRLSSICIMLFLDLVMSGLIVGSVIISSWFYYKPVDDTVPSWIEKIVRCKHSDNKVDIVDEFFSDENDDKKPPLDMLNTKNGKPTFSSNNNTDKITWQKVALFWDKLSLIFFILMYIGSIISFTINIQSGK